MALQNVQVCNPGVYHFCGLLEPIQKLCGQEFALNRIKLNKPVGKSMLFHYFRAKNSFFKLSGTIGVLLHLGLPHHHRFKRTGHQGQIQLSSTGR
jgi:hypothetical protein